MELKPKAGFGNIVNEVDKKLECMPKPLWSPSQVVEYLGRYSHKIAITKHRIVSVTDTHVNFRYKDYADQDKTKLLSLSREEFLAIRNAHPAQTFYKKSGIGFMQNHGKRSRLQQIRQYLQLTITQNRKLRSHKNARKVWKDI
jgi:hypothetical protein